MSETRKDENGFPLAEDRYTGTDGYVELDLPEMTEAEKRKDECFRNTKSFCFWCQRPVTQSYRFYLCHNYMTQPSRKIPVKVCLAAQEWATEDRWKGYKNERDNGDKFAARMDRHDFERDTLDNSFDFHDFESGGEGDGE